MNSALWIAIAAAVAVILAHIGLVWWFLFRGNSPKPKAPEEIAAPKQEEH